MLLKQMHLNKNIAVGRADMLRLRVREIAQEKGFTMAGLQRAADINLKTLQAIYRDPYRDVAYSTLYKLAKILDVPITDLVEETLENTGENDS